MFVESLVWPSSARRDRDRPLGYVRVVVELESWKMSELLKMECGFKCGKSILFIISIVKQVYFLTIYLFYRFFTGFL